MRMTRITPGSERTRKKFPRVDRAPRHFGSPPRQGVHDHADRTQQIDRCQTSSYSQKRFGLSPVMIDKDPPTGDHVAPWK